MLEWAEGRLLIACASLTPCAAIDDQLFTPAVDIFNVTSGAWSTATLHVARSYVAATSLPNLGVAIFAGGWSMCCHAVLVIYACCVLRVEESDARVGGGSVADCVCQSHAFRSGQRQL
jgi:hypothetical protein